MIQTPFVQDWKQLYLNKFRSESTGSNGYTIQYELNQLNKRLENNPKLQEYLLGSFYVDAENYKLSNIKLVLEAGLYKEYMESDIHDKGYLLAVLQYRNDIKLLTHVADYVKRNKDESH